MSVKLRVWGRALTICAIVLSTWLWAGAAEARVEFFDETDAAIGSQQICPGGNQNGAPGTYPNGWLNKSINVTSGPANAADMTIRLVATHTYRGDIRMDVRKQGTTTWTTVIGVSNENDDNYNVEINQNNAELINTGNSAGAHSTATTANPFPVNTGGNMAAFNGTPAVGTWEFRFCDNDYRDNGTILRLGLVFLLDGDLSVDVALSDTTPAENGTVDATYTVTNTGTSTQTNVVLTAEALGNLTVSSSTPSAGTYSGTTWTIPSLAAGASATLVQSTTLISGTGTYSIDLTSADLPDPFPANDSASQDANAQPSSTVPTLSCSRGEVYDFSWAETGTNSWPGGSLTQSYVAVDTDATTADIPLTLTMTSPGGDAAAQGFFAGAVSTPSPRTRLGWDGGTGSTASLYVGLSFPDTSASSSVTMTMDLGIPADGVEKFQFAITDIDRGSYRDRITVSGFANGNPVPAPILTPGPQVEIIGSAGQASATAGNAAATSGDGNMTVTFENPVDQIVLTYDNGPGSSSPPGTQAVALQDISICRRLLPDVEAVKLVEVYDPSSAGLYMTPGNEVLYTIAVTNRGPLNSGTAEAAANDIDLSDILPDNLRFVSASTNGFTGGSITNPPASNTDCLGGNCVVSFEDGSLGIDETGEIIVRALIK